MYSFTQHLKLEHKVSMNFRKYVVVIIIENWYKTVLGRSGVGADLHKFALVRIYARKRVLILCRIECLYST
jgi:hypothetical protein